MTDNISSGFRLALAYATRRTLVALFLIVVAISAAAQDGSSAYQYLNITSSSRIYGLGGVNITAVEDELSVTDQNPALLGPEMDTICVTSVRAISPGLATPTPWANVVLGAPVSGISGTAKCRVPMSLATPLPPTSSFSPSDVNFNGSFSYDITDRLRGGITLKLLYSSYESYSAFAVGADLGINYYDPDHELSLSAVVANLGGQLKRFNTTYDRLPFDIRLGIAKKFGTLPIRFSITAWQLTKWHLPFYETGDGTTDEEFKVKDTFFSNLFRHLIFGVDFIPSERFYVALGYNYKSRTDMSTYKRSFVSGFSLAAGLNLRRFNVGLAIAQPHSGATTFMLNLNLNLNDILYQ